MKEFSFPRLNLNKLKTYSIKNRRNLVQVKQFARIVPPGRDFNKFLESLPDLLAGRLWNRLIEAIVKARRNNRLVGVSLGAHVIKCGLSPVIIDLMKRGLINAVALHGAGAIHDYEISLIGATSEDVQANIKTGRFGMARETAEVFNRAARVACGYGKGLGQALGELILADKNKYAGYSILAAGRKLNLPITVHVAFGTDTVHMHPGLSGAALGEATLADFHKLISVVCHLNKGVWLNIGSAVILPEVFLKAVSVARNLGYRLNDFTTANLDMIQHYRPKMNVTGRPTPPGGEGISITGHHEIMLPLLRWSILAKLKNSE
ncbi:MAG: hypothetical protein AAB019_05450 [Planctomycetota bacterium]